MIFPKGGQQLGVPTEAARLASFYALYFAALGAFVPYWGPYLKDAGLSALQIGILTALVQVSKVFAPNLWGSLAERTGDRLRVIHWATLSAAAGFALLFFTHDFFGIALATLLFSFFWAASLPLVETTTLDWSRRTGGRYGRVRLWGSLGFIAVSLSLGGLIEHWGQWLFLVVVLALLLGVWLAGLGLPGGERHPVEEGARVSALALLRRPGVLAFFLGCALEQASHGPYYAFYSIYLGQHGISGLYIGLLWAFAVLCEVGFFLVSERVVASMGLRKLLIASFSFTLVRWAIIAAWPNLGFIVFAQVLHAASYAGFHAAAVNLTYRQFAPAERVQGQALYTSIAFGFGGAIGGLAAGAIWQQWGGSASFVAAALATGLGLLLILLAGRRMQALQPAG
ncbi:MFS transporter [Thermithiobacillus plumbiphilus]|uniref:MFS transporter n=1 Tax=Thermithiobacillus plumbiphilus TaxID=1729899 RepID=A0ABU9D6G8_9PROT